MSNYILLALGWCLYLFLHSFLATMNVKKWANKELGTTPKMFRLLYSIFSIIGFLLLIALNELTKGQPLFYNTEILNYLSILIIILGMIVIGFAFREYKLTAFIGLADETPDFKVTGILTRVRHPIYSGTILILIGMFLFMPTLATLVSVACMLLYLPIGIKLEENKLLALFGEEYQQYKREVPAIFPKLFQKATK